jgi:hypothetical protein
VLAGMAPVSGKSFPCKHLPNARNIAVAESKLATYWVGFKPTASLSPSLLVA